VLSEGRVAVLDRPLRDVREPFADQRGPVRTLRVVVGHVESPERVSTRPEEPTPLVGLEHHPEIPVTGDEGQLDLVEPPTPKAESIRLNKDVPSRQVRRTP
jgi:hypothetical protein